MQRGDQHPKAGVFRVAGATIQLPSMSGFGSTATPLVDGVPLGVPTAPDASVVERRGGGGVLDGDCNTPERASKKFLAMLFPCPSVNQMFPSGPAVMPYG